MCKNIYSSINRNRERGRERGSQTSVSSKMDGWIMCSYNGAVYYHSENKCITTALYNTLKSHGNNVEWKDTPHGIIFLEFQNRRNLWVLKTRERLLLWRERRHGGRAGWWAPECRRYFGLCAGDVSASLLWTSPHYTLMICVCQSVCVPLNINLP